MYGWEMKDASFCTGFESFPFWEDLFWLLQRFSISQQMMDLLLDGVAILGAYLDEKIPFLSNLEKIM